MRCQLILIFSTCLDYILDQSIMEMDQYKWKKIDAHRLCMTLFDLSQYVNIFESM